MAPKKSKAQIVREIAAIMSGGESTERTALLNLYERKRMQPAASSTPAKLDGEIAALKPHLKKWNVGVAAYRRELVKLEAGADNWEAASRAYDRLYKIENEIAKHVGTRDPIIEGLQRERSSLPKWKDAQETGRKVRSDQQYAEIRRLRDDERDYQRSRPR